MTNPKNVKFHITEDFKIGDNNYQCPCCEKQGSKKSIALHYYHRHTPREKFLQNCFNIGAVNLGKEAWNKGNPNSNGLRWNSGLTSDTSEKVRQLNEKSSITRKLLYATGKLKLSQKCLTYLKSDEHRNKMREITKYRIQLGHGTAKGAWLKDSFGVFCYLGSSYEIKVASFLDELKILWARPKCLTYIDDMNQERLYFPDLYLPEYDLYLDPKNSFLLKLHQRKLDLVVEQNKINLEVITEANLSLVYLEKLLTRFGTPTRVRT